MQVFIGFITISVAFGYIPVQYSNRHKQRHDSVERFSARSSDAIETDVLIIGAGLSGLETARLLNERGVKSTILEARDRIGGRVWSVKMKNDHIFDMGAAWIHGIDGSIPGGYWTNPLWDLVQEAKLETRATEISDSRVFPPYQAYLEVMMEWYEEYVTFVRTHARDTGANETLKYYADAFIEEHRLNEEQKNAFLTFLHVLVENQEGAELELISGRDVFYLTSNHYGPEHVFHKTGFKSVIDYLAKDLSDIRLERIVTNIYYNSSMVEVHTANHEIYRAKYALVTVPLGILKGQTIEFNPPLPKWKMDAINRMGFGLLDKAIVLWDKAWWNETEYFFIRGSSTPNKFSFWVNANKWNDRPAMFCYFVGQEAVRLENMEQTEVIKEVLSALRGMFPNRNISDPIDSFFTTWKRDRFSNGSYSFISIDQRHQDPALLTEPLEDRLLFAGEATNVDTYGFAHGALISGRREATRLLHVYGLLSDQPVKGGQFNRAAAILPIS